MAVIAEDVEGIVGSCQLPHRTQMESVDGGGLDMLVVVSAKAFDNSIRDDKYGIRVLRSLYSPHYHSPLYHSLLLLRLQNMQKARWECLPYSYFRNCVASILEVLLFFYRISNRRISIQTATQSLRGIIRDVSRFNHSNHALLRPWNTPRVSGIHF